MAILSNINGKFAVDSTGAVQFNGQAGTSGYVLKSNGNSAPTWVDPSTVIGGPYLPLSGGTLTGATATASNIAFTVGGNLTVNGSSFLEATDIVGGAAYPLQVTSTQRYMVQVRNLNNTVSSNYGWWWFMDTNFNMGFHADGASDKLTLTRDGDLSVGGFITTPAQERISVGTWDNSAFTGGNAQGFSVQGVTPGLFILETDQTNKKSYLAMSGGGMYLGGSINFLGIDTDGARAVTIDDSQRVGIGDTSPAKPLVVYSAAPPGGITIKAQSGNASNWIQNVSTGSSWQIGSTSGGWQLYNDNTSAYRLTVTSDGMVGIGMTPGTAGGSTYMLQMYNSGSQCFLAIGNGTSGNGPTNGLVIGNDTGNAWIVNREATPMIFATNDVERMRIASSGEIIFGNSGTNNAGFIDFDGTSVQINTQRNPNTGAFVDTAKSNASINLVGANGGSYIRFNTASANNTTATERMRIASNGDTTHIASYSGGTFPFRVGYGSYSSFTPTFVINDNGNVGIDTTSPTAKLEVVCANGANAFRANFGGSADIFMGFDNANPYLLLQDNSNVTTHLFQSNVNNYIVGSNVGIGTTSPSANLHVSSTSTAVLKVGTTGVADASVDIRGYDAGVHIGDDTNGLRWAIWNDGPSTSSSLKFGSYALGTWYNDSSQVVTMTSDGKVGIGTTSPSSKLTVYGGSSTTSTLELRGGAAGNDNATISTQQSMTFQIGSAGASGRSFVFNKGGLGYGNGTNLASINDAGTFTATGDVVAYSDKKLKKNIKTLDGSKVYKMRGVSFDRIDTGKKSSGVIAQEIQEIAPELVNESDGTLGVAYGNLTGYLIEAIKELEVRVKELENKNCDCKE